MKDTPHVALITVNYNSAKHTINFLRSCQQLNYHNITIVVVDNGSQQLDEDLAEYCYSLKNVKFLRSDVNLGFAGGNNLGLMQINADYYFFINNDTLLPKHTIETLLSNFEDASIGAVSPTVVRIEDSSIQYGGSSALDPIRVKMTWQNGPAGYQEFLHGCAMMVSKEAIQKAGAWPEIYFLYYEELEWCESIKRAGFKLYYDDRVQIQHMESASTGKNSPLKTHYIWRNRFLFTRRNIFGMKKYLALGWLSFIALPKHLVTLIINKQTHLIPSIFKAIKWNLHN